MKKTLLVLSVLLISAVSFGQIKKDTSTVKPVVKNTDTLVVDLSKTKVVMIGNQAFKVEVLSKPGLYLTVENINTLFMALDEQPAKFANPFAAWLRQFLGLR